VHDDELRRHAFGTGIAVGRGHEFDAGHQAGDRIHLEPGSRRSA